MEIRKALLKDLDTLANLFDQYRVFYEKQSDLSAGKEFLKARLTNKDSEIFILEIGHEMAGFIQLYPLFSSTRMKKIWLLNDLYIIKNLRGKGGAKLLIEQAKTLCKETEACGLLLETAKSNIIGNSLYLSEGFYLQTENNYYSWDVSDAALKSQEVFPM